MIKLIATDMDHTLLDNASQLPDNFSDFIEDVKRNGIVFVAASGRSLYNIKEKLKDFLDDVSIVSDNGALVWYQNEIVYKSVLDRHLLLELIHASRQCTERSLVAITDKAAYVELGHPDHKEMLHEYYLDYHIVDDLTLIDEDFIKFTILSVDHTVSNYEKYIAPVFNDRLNAVLSGKVWIDVMNKDVNKANGLRHLLDRLQIDPKDTVAFGDYHNDIEMLKLAGTGYAVANAHDDVKRFADKIIGSNEDNSVIKTLYRDYLK